MVTDSFPELGASARVLRPGDDGYDEARLSFNGMVDRRPAVIVQPATTDDVVAAVRAARETGLPVAIRGGGHSVSGHAIAEGALVVDLRRMRTVTVDPERRLARAGGGALWEDVDGATVPHSLFVPGGTFVDTGIGGLTLTGGIGFLMGTGGLTCDNLVEATVVTADGSVVTASADGDSDLLWALRGGGGNFGVVTEFVFGLHPLREIHVGAYAVPLADAAAGLEAVAALQRVAPPELLFTIVGPTTETRPANDAESVGPREFVRLFGIFHGPFAEAEAALAPMRSLPNLSGGIVPITYPDLQAISGIMPFGLRNYWKGHFVRDLDAERDHGGRHRHGNSHRPGLVPPDRGDHRPGTRRAGRRSGLRAAGGPLECLRAGDLGGPGRRCHADRLGAERRRWAGSLVPDRRRLRQLRAGRRDCRTGSGGLRGRAVRTAAPGQGAP